MKTEEKMNAIGAIVNAINGQVPIDLSAYAQVSQANNWTKNQSFLAEVFLQGGQPTSLESAVNRGWVETYVANELANNVPQGGTLDTTANYTWTGNNVFNGKLESGTTATSIDDLTDKEIPTKKLVVEKIESFRVVSADEPSGDYPVGTIWIKTSYEQSPNDPTNFIDKPALFICLGNRQWWDLHKEELIK